MKFGKKEEAISFAEKQGKKCFVRWWMETMGLHYLQTRASTSRMELLCSRAQGGQVCQEVLC